MVEIRSCPSCGSGRIEKVCGEWTGEYRGETYTVEKLRYHQCPDCGERVYDAEAMRTIEAHSPAFRGSAVGR